MTMNDATNALNDQVDTTVRTSTDVEQAKTQQEKIQEMIELESLDKFKFRGKEWTPEDIDKAMLLQADYTRKTQAISAESKFIDNLDADLRAVRSNPEKTSEFKKLYPEKYHKFLDVVMDSRSRVDHTDDTDSEELSPAALKKIAALERKLSKVDDVVALVQAREAEAANQHIDAVFLKLGDKYAYANEDAVLNRAERMVYENRNNPNFRLTEAGWDRVFKQVNEEIKTKVESRYKSDLESQLKKSKQASDSPAGGSAPGREARKVSFKDAQDFIIEDLKAKGYR